MAQEVAQIVRTPTFCGSAIATVSTLFLIDTGMIRYISAIGCGTISSTCGGMFVSSRLMTGMPH